VLEKYYSGENSKAFWETINLIDSQDGTLYRLGCELQALEEDVLKEINNRKNIINNLKSDYDAKNPKNKNKK
jgi:hypothetical protein